MSIKKKYVNENIDGYKEENQSPLAPAWLFSGKQNEGKVLTGGPNGFVVWSEGQGGSGTTNYNLLNNKPSINGIELLGNITLTYVKSVSQENDTLTFKNQNNETILEYTPSQITQYIKNAYVSGNTLTLTKQDNSRVIFELNTSAVNQLISDYLTQNIFSLLKSKLGSGFVVDDENQTISVATIPQPPKPNFTGIFSFDSQANRYRMYDPATIFSPNDSITYLLLDVNSSQPSEPVSYPNTIARQIFNEPIFINDSLGNFDGGVSGWSGFTGFLANCLTFNQPLDLSNCNWKKIGHVFMKLCTAFNSEIKFPNSIQFVGVEFMEGCSSFNKSIQTLMTPNLGKIEHSFLAQCTNFSQDIDITNTGIYLIELDNFMYDCKMFAVKQFLMTNKQITIFQPDNATGSDSDVLKACATSDSTALIYTSGFKFSAHNLTKQDFDNYTITVNSITIQPFKNSSESPYKKIIVNGVGE